MIEEFLKLELSKLLSDKMLIKTWTSSTLGEITYICWKSNNNQVSDSEWLYVCSLLEQQMNDMEADKYLEYLEELFFHGEKGYDRDLFRATWQQRAEAILKLKQKIE